MSRVWKVSRKRLCAQSYTLHTIESLKKVEDKSYSDSDDENSEDDESSDE